MKKRLALLSRMSAWSALAAAVALPSAKLAAQPTIWTWTGEDATDTSWGSAENWDQVGQGLVPSDVLGQLAIDVVYPDLEVAGSPGTFRGSAISTVNGNYELTFNSIGDQNDGDGIDTFADLDFTGTRTNYTLNGGTIRVGNRIAPVAIDAVLEVYGQAANIVVDPQGNIRSFDIVEPDPGNVPPDQLIGWPLYYIDRSTPDTLSRIRFQGIETTEHTFNTTVEIQGEVNLINERDPDDPDQDANAAFITFENVNIIEDDLFPNFDSPRHFIDGVLRIHNEGTIVFGGIVSGDGHIDILDTSSDDSVIVFGDLNADAEDDANTFGDTSDGRPVDDTNTAGDEQTPDGFFDSDVEQVGNATLEDPDDNIFQPDLGNVLVTEQIKRSREEMDLRGNNGDDGDPAVGIVLRKNVVFTKTGAEGEAPILVRGENPTIAAGNTSETHVTLTGIFDLIRDPNLPDGTPSQALTFTGVNQELYDLGVRDVPITIDGIIQFGPDLDPNGTDNSQRVISVGTSLEMEDIDPNNPQFGQRNAPLEVTIGPDSFIKVEDLPADRFDIDATDLDESILPDRIADIDIVKRGAGTLVLQNDNDVVNNTNDILDHRFLGGFVIEEGTVRFSRGADLLGDLGTITIGNAADPGDNSVNYTPAAGENRAVGDIDGVYLEAVTGPDGDDFIEVAPDRFKVAGDFTYRGTASDPDNNVDGDNSFDFLIFLTSVFDMGNRAHQISVEDGLTLWFGFDGGAGATDLVNGTGLIKDGPGTLVMNTTSDANAVANYAADYADEPPAAVFAGPVEVRGGALLLGNTDSLAATPPSSSSSQAAAASARPTAPPPHSHATSSSRATSASPARTRPPPGRPSPSSSRAAATSNSPPTATSTAQTTSSVTPTTSMPRRRSLSTQDAPPASARPSPPTPDSPKPAAASSSSSSTTPTSTATSISTPPCSPSMSPPPQVREPSTTTDSSPSPSTPTPRRARTTPPPSRSSATRPSATSPATASSSSVPARPSPPTATPPTPPATSPA